MAAMKNSRSPALPEPTRGPITFRGNEVTPLYILDLFRDAQRARQKSRMRILRCRAMRRKEPSSLPKVSRKWARKFPEAAALATLTSEERITLDRDMIASAGAVEPNFECEPLGFNVNDGPRAEAQQSYFNEWRQRNVPTQAFVGKSVEDGEFGVAVMPCDLDMDGCPDYFEYLDEAAYKALDDKERGAYRKDESDRRGRYVKQDEKGKAVPKARYADTLKEPDDDKKLPAKERETKREQRHQKAQQQHEEDVTQYILRKQLDADAIRLIPALDCAPVFKRGRRRDRWELVALVERVLYEPWELIQAGYAWKGMHDRLLVPQGYREDDIGVQGQVYLYTAYLTVTEKDEKGILRTHPLVLYTVGGASTAEGTEPEDERSVGIIDLYEEYGIEGQLFGYFGGLHGEDDDPDYYWQPLLWAVLDRLKAKEGMAGAIRAATAVNAFTGHFEQTDPRWAGTEEGIEAILDTGGELRRARMPGPGEIEPAIGPVVPASQAQVGADAWRSLDMDSAALERATAIDQIPSGGGGAQPSGHALLVQTSLGQVAKRQIRDGVKAAVIFCGEAHLRILHAIYEKYGIRWPIRTTQEQPVKDQPTEARTPAVYDPEWVKDGQFNLNAEYPEEENLARIDQEANLAERGFGNTDRVYKAMGEQDPEAARLKGDRDRLMKHPLVDLLRMKRVAKRLGDRELEEIVAMQAEQLMAPDVPGVPGGVPTAAVPSLQQQGQQMGGAGGQNPGANIRGGVVGAEQAGDAMQADATAALQGAAA